MTSKPRPLVWGIIPARYESQRFPGKLLAPLGNTSIIHHTYHNAQQAKRLDHLLIATDHEKIADHVTTFGAHPVFTPPCDSGTERVAWTVEHLAPTPRPDVVVVIQGDEPVLSPHVIDQLITTLEDNPSLSMATAATRIRSKEIANNPSIVKVVINQRGEALYFSRACIPRGHTDAFDSDTPYHHHIGIYAFQTDFLLSYPTLPSTPLQEAEDLEQLRILEHGYRIGVTLVEEQAPGIDTPEDLHYLEKWLWQHQQNTSLSLAASAPHLGKG